MMKASALYSSGFQPLAFGYRLSAFGQLPASRTHENLITECEKVARDQFSRDAACWPKADRRKPKACFLLSRFDLGRLQPNLIYTGRVGDIDHLGYIRERHFVVASDEHDAFGAGLEYVSESRLQVVPRDIVLVDLQHRTLPGNTLIHGNNDRTIVRFLLLLLVLRRLRNERVETAGRERRDDHEDDQQHQQNVDQRGYVDACAGAATLAPHCHCHIEILDISATRGGSKLLAARGGFDWLVCQWSLLLGEQAQLIDSCRTNVIHNRYNGSVLRASVSLHVNALVGLVGQTIADFIAELVGAQLVVIQIDLIVTRDGDQDCVFFIRIRHLLRIVGLRQLDAVTFLQHGRDDHEDDQQNQHHSDHRRDIDIGVDLLAFVSFY